MEGIPSTVVVVDGEKIVSPQAGIQDINNPTDAVHSRARARRNDEPAPFLCIDNLPVDKVVVDGRTPAHAAPRKAMGTVLKDSGEVKSILTGPKRHPSAVQGPGPSRVTSRVSVRNSPSSAMYNYNSFFTHKNPAFLSGPPTLWSMNNRFWPHATPPSEKPRLPPLPSALNLEIANQMPKNTQPFKHGSSEVGPVQDRPVSPSFELKVQTVSAIRNVSRKLSRQSPPSTANEASGRLLKGRLKPLQTFKVNGPPIHRCQGIQPGSGRSYTPSQSRLLQRKRELLNMLPPDVFQTRPQTEQSVHRTSLASTWNEAGEEELQSDLKQDMQMDAQDVGDPTLSSKHPCYQPPNSPTEQLDDPTADTSRIETKETLPQDLLTDGGAAQILYNMVSKAKASPGTDDSSEIAARSNIEGSLTDIAVLSCEGCDHVTSGNLTEESLQGQLASGTGRRRSEPDLSSAKMNLINDAIAGGRRGSDDQLEQGHRNADNLPGSEMFDVTFTGIVEGIQGDVAEDLDRNYVLRNSVDHARTSSLPSRSGIHENGEVLEHEESSFEKDPTVALDANGNLEPKSISNEQRGPKFFFSEQSDRSSSELGVTHVMMSDDGHENDSSAGPGKVPEHLAEMDNSDDLPSTSQFSDKSDNLRNSEIDALCRTTSRDGPREEDDTAVVHECDDVPGYHHGNRQDEILHGDSFGNRCYTDKLGDQPGDADYETGGDEQTAECVADGNTHPSVNQTNSRSSCKEEVSDVCGGGEENDDEEGESGSSGRGNNPHSSPRNHIGHTDSSTEKNVNNSADEAGTGGNEDSLEDVPDVSESVLFCAYCKLDFDDCRCYLMQDPVLMAYQGILTQEGVESQTAELDARGQGQGRKRLRGRPRSAPCSLMEEMTVIQGTGMLVNSDRSDDQENITRNDGGQQEINQSENLPTEEMSVVATPLPIRNPRTAGSMLPPPLNFRLTGRPPDGMVYYFSYGAEMNAERLIGYLGGDQPIQRLWGVLYGFQIQFDRRGMELSAGGFANISYEPESSVEGCVYCLTLDQLDKLDTMTGYPKFQIKVVLPVWMINCPHPGDHGVAQCCIPAVMYVCRDAWTHDGALCNSYNLQQCLVGGDLLTPAYRNHLQSLQCDCCQEIGGTA